jgi:phosphate transport system substrate-binding protein
MSAGTPPSPGAPTPSPRPVVRRKADRGRVLAIAVVVVVAAIVLGAGATTDWFGLRPAATSTAACPTGITTSGAGASFLTTILTQWESGYASASSNKVNYNPDGAGDGITSFSEKQVQFAATDEPVTSQESSSFPGTTLTLPVTGGAVTIVYDLPGYDHTLQLNATTLIGIYTGTISNWDSPKLNVSGLNPDLPDATIIPVVRSDGAGTTYVLTNYLSDDSSSWASTVGTSIQPTWPTVPNGTERAEKGNSGLATFVDETPDAIGYVDLADAESHSNLAIAAVENPSQAYVVPTVADTQSAINDLSGQPIPPATGNWSAVSWVNALGPGDYPLATLSYFLVLQDPGIGYEASDANTTALVWWLDWILTAGQAALYTSDLYYVVPPMSLVTQDLEAVSSVNYNGASIPTCT